MEEIMLISKFVTENIVEEISGTEKKYGFEFPVQYKQFLIKYNGGYTPKTKFKINGVASDVNAFLGVGNAEINYSQITTEAMTDLVEKEVIPIAEDSFGNYILIGVSGDLINKIFFWDHEKSEKKLLTQDFLSFINKCRRDIINEAAKRSIKEREDDLIAKGRGHIITDSLKAMWQKEIDKYEKISQEEVNL